MGFEKKKGDVIARFISFSKICLFVCLIFASFSLLSFGSVDINNYGSVPSNSHEVYAGVLGTFENIYSIKEIQTVSADEDDWCCVKENSDGSGKVCENMSSSDAQNSCSENAATSCSNVNKCSTGTCVYDKGLSCNSNSVKWKCEQNGGDFKNKPMEEISQCQKGCCDLGNSARYITERKCKQEVGSDSDINDVNFDSGKSRNKCLQEFPETLEEGACVSDDGSCEFLSQDECSTEGTDREFHPGKLCTNDDLETICEPTNQTRCSDNSGDYNVYFVDNCDNLANVYDSSKTYDKDPSYWQEKIEPSCNSEPGSSSCGDCNYPEESKCSPTEVGDSVDHGNYICRDLQCNDSKGNIRKNGESWCVYESEIGSGNGIVGTGHWLKYCEDGKVKTDTDKSKKRNEICAERQTDEGISIAQYRPNMAPRCLEINKEEDVESNCKRNPDCKLYELDVSEDAGVSGNFCIPKYPLGTLNPKGKSGDSQEVCRAASITCTRVETGDVLEGGKDPAGDTGKCTNLKFAKQANKICRSVGDCGGSINLEGSYSRSFNVGPYSALDGYSLGYDREDWEKGEDFVGTSGSHSKKMAYELPPNATPEYLKNPQSSGGIGDYSGFYQDESKDFGDNYGFYGATEMLAESNLYDVPLLNYIAVGVSGVIETLANSLGWLFGGGKVWRQKKKTDIKFRCDQYSVPSNGDCSACQEGDFPCTEYKCSSLGANCKFTGGDTKNPICVEEFQEHEKDPSIDFEGTSPSFDYENLEDGNGVEIESCMESNSEVDFEISTSEDGEGVYSSCGYSYENVEVSDIEGDINDYYPRSSSGWKKNHTFTQEFSLSQDTDYSDQVFDLTKTDTERKGKLDLNFRCEDTAGNFKEEEFKVRFCITSKDETPPKIESFDPENDGHIAYGKNYTNVTLQLNEPVDSCKYSFSGGRSYSDMPNSFDNCQEDVCFEKPMEGLDKEKNDVFIKCNDTAGNINDDDFEYVLKETENPLVIESASLVAESVQGEETYDLNSSESIVVESGGGSLSTELRVEASGGLSEDLSCEYLFDDFPKELNGVSGLTLTKDGSQSYSGELNTLVEGSYEMSLVCGDGVNKDTLDTKFELSLDNSAPDIVKNSTSIGNLEIILDEPAQCSYDTTSCNFDLDEGEAYDFGSSEDFVKNQSTEWNPSKPYFTKCRDKYNNQDCTKINNDSAVNGPGITRIWEESGDLRVKTDRQGQCYFGFNDCGFDILEDPENGMSGGDVSRTHLTDWNPSNTYYIKCKDKWGNPNPSCAAIVQPHTL